MLKGSIITQRKAHPNVFEIVKILKKKQALTEVTMGQLDAGAAPSIVPGRRLKRLMN